ncbi:ABC transporter ATP-binding protein [Nesterenkonia haasae]|uniref:ABC transporter ATP-binding protein n=1 Tax=Nesterenkonia haasae TaxID=2587813 RepID=UPI001390ACE2|nr:ABC transporter ATP-binding protein [Nesterenkonia haasae]NDK32570.1 ABC transporter ATP-binding protein [Nesterenkonia haasae]
MILEAKNVSKTFRSGGRGGLAVHAVKSANLTAARGEFVAIVGESGSGKSTLARMLLDLHPASEGTIFLRGVDVKSMSKNQRRDFRRTVQAVLQDPAGSLNPRKSVSQSIGEVIRLHKAANTKRDIRQKTLTALELVGLDPASHYLDRFPHELSGGQRQRVLIARAVALNPQIIIADEAVSALDASVKAGVLRVMADLQERLNVGYVFITHDLPVVKKVADYVHVMYRGEIVEHGPAQEIFQSPQHEYTATLLDATPSLDALDGAAPTAPGASAT